MKLLLLIDSNRLKEGILLCEKQQYKDIVHDVLKINTSWKFKLNAKWFLQFHLVEILIYS